MHGETLRIGRDLAGEQRQFQVGEQLVRVRRRMPPAGGAIDLLGGDALVLQRRQHARGHRRLDRRRRNAERLRLDDRPFAGALLAGAVEDHVDHRLAGLRDRRPPAPSR